MPRGKYVNHKGRNRHFTDVEELEQERKKAEEKKRWRQQHGEDEESESEEASEKEESSAASESEEESSDEDDDDGKAKGVQGLIEVENPNRVKKKAANKVTTIDTNAASSSAKPELSRREREELEKQRAAANYSRLHAQGKTEQARADLARLALIKQQRAEAAARREQEKKEKEAKKGGSTR